MKNKLDKYSRWKTKYGSNKVLMTDKSRGSCTRIPICGWVRIRSVFNSWQKLLVLTFEKMGEFVVFNEKYSWPNSCNGAYFTDAVTYVNPKSEEKTKLLQHKSGTTPIFHCLKPIVILKNFFSSYYHRMK